MASLSDTAAKVNSPTLDSVRAEVRSALWTAAVFSFVINILMLATPLYMLQVMDRVLRSGRVETLVLLTLIALGAVLVMSVLETLRGSIAMRTGAWLKERLGPVLLEGSVRASLRGDQRSGEPLRDLNEVRQFVANLGLEAFFDSPWVPIFVVFIWFLHPYLGMVALGAALLILVLGLASEWVMKKPTEAAYLADLEATQLSDMTIRNAEVVKSMGLMPALTWRWRMLNADVTNAYHLSGERAGQLLSATKFVRTAVGVIILGVGAYLVVHNEITGGTMIAAAILLGRALSPVELAISGWKGFMDARLAYGRIVAFLEAYPETAEHAELPTPDGHLSVENVSFAISDGGPLVIEDVSFKVEPGEALAIVGPSGAGKSTLCRMLVGLADPTRGAVRLDGTDLRHWRSEQLGRSIGFLPQDVELFPGTVRENIARMGGVEDSEIVEAARRARVHQLIQRLPESYMTYIGEGGVRLSGGQRQRIGFARAVFGDPRLLVLDEPNANLDQAGESALVESIKELKRDGCALIIVGHRPSTLSQADKILVLKDGKVALFGSRDDVMEAWSEASAGTDSIPLRRAPEQSALNKPSESSREADAS
jgi:PrtD family type I secretion system ABC transporter